MKDEKALATHWHIGGYTIVPEKKWSFLNFIINSNTNSPHLIEKSIKISWKISKISLGKENFHIFKRERKKKMKKKKENFFFLSNVFFLSFLSQKIEFFFQVFIHSSEICAEVTQSDVIPFPFPIGVFLAIFLFQIISQAFFQYTYIFPIFQCD